MCCLCASRAGVALVQECEASPHCRRLQLKDLLVSEMHRITKYPLLLDKIIKYTEGEKLITWKTHDKKRKKPAKVREGKLVCPAAGAPDLPLLQRAQACCRGILQTINEVVRETEHRQQLSQYQRRLDAAPQFKVATSWTLARLLLTLLTFRFIHPFCFCLAESGLVHQEDDSRRSSDLESQ